MANGTILNVSVSRDGGQICAAVQVAEGGATGNVEYIGCVPFDDAFQALTNGQKKAALVQAVKAVRDAQTAAETPVAGLTGQVTL